MTLGVLVLLVVTVRGIADPLATHATRRALAGLDDLDGTVARVHVAFFPPGNVVEGLKLVERGSGSKAPLLYVERAHSRLAWRRLFRGVIELDQHVTGAKLTIAKPLDREHLARLEALVRKVPHLLQVLPRAKIDRMELTDGELLVIDTGHPQRPRLWLHDLTMSASDIVTRPALAGGQPLVSSLRGRIQRSGTFTARVALPRPHQGVSFDLRMALAGLPTSELHAFLAPSTDLTAPEGRMSTFAAMSVRKGEVTGWVRPVLDDVEVRAATDDFGDRVKAWLADKSIDLFADEKPGGRETLAKTIPLRGQIERDRSVFASAALILRASLREAIAEAVGAGAEADEKAQPVPPETRGRRTSARRR